MNEEQKAKALALRWVPGVYQWCESPRMPREWVQGHTGIMTPVLNLADQSGAVEGVLHRVLERLVGEPVEVAQSMLTSGARGWRCAPCSNARGGWLPAATRLEAIVAALLAMAEQGGKP